MEYQYLYDLNDQKNWINPKLIRRPDGTISEDIHIISFSQGKDSLYRVTDSTLFPVAPGTEEIQRHHSHHGGFEFFYWLTGSQHWCVNNKVAYCDAGKFTIVHPYDRHGGIFHEPSRKIGFFHNMPLSQDDSDAGVLLDQYRPGAKKSPDFPSINDNEYHSGPPLSDNFGAEPPTEIEEVPWEEMPNIRHISKPLAEFKFDGVTMKMLSSRWENWGVVEIWGAEMEKGFCAEWNKYPIRHEMYFIPKGKVKFKVYDEEFIAYDECIVKIPKYAEHSIEVLEDTVMYDVGGQTFWFEYLMDLFSIKKNDPARYNDPAAMAALKRRHGCEIKSIGRK